MNSKTTNNGLLNKLTFLASFSAFNRNFSSFFRFSAEYSFFLFSSAIFSSILLVTASVPGLVVDCPPINVLRLPDLPSGSMKKLRDVDGAGEPGFSTEIKTQTKILTLLWISMEQSMLWITSIAFQKQINIDSDGRRCVPGVIVRVADDADLMGATFAVMPNFDVADGTVG